MKNRRQRHLVAVLLRLGVGVRLRRASIGLLRLGYERDLIEASQLFDIDKREKSLYLRDKRQAKGGA